MPYFSWKGVNLNAQICKGMQFARNQHELDGVLFKKDIALLAFSQRKIVWKPAISLQSKIDYFMQLTLLIKAGILLPDALNLVAQQTHNTSFAAIAHDITDRVQQGHSLSYALTHWPNVFDPLMIQMITVGQESGSLPAALQVLTIHLESLALFKARLKAALVLPAVTFCFFLAIICIMLVVIVPQFVALFASMHRDLPEATKTMMAVSNFLRSGYSVCFGIAFLGMCSIVRAYTKTARGKLFFDRMVMALPFAKTIVINKTMSGFFQSIALLLQGGMPLVKALTIAKESINNQVIKKHMENLEYEVNAGGSFAQALAGYQQLIGQEMIALIAVGQEAGMLCPMLVRIADLYQQRLLRVLSRINTLFQPFLLIILGLLITGLILALYTPIMSLSYAV